MSEQDAVTIDIDRGISPFTIEELESGLRLLSSGDVDQNAFWDENIAAFRQTVLLAIRETSDALLAPNISLRWRVEFETQLQSLAQYVELADRYIAERSGEAWLRPRFH
jgi:hypothetical protein